MMPGISFVREVFPFFVLAGVVQLNVIFFLAIQWIWKVLHCE